MPNGLRYIDRVILTVLKEAEKTGTPIQSERKLELLMFLLDFYNPTLRKISKYPFVDANFSFDPRDIIKSTEIRMSVRKLLTSGYAVFVYRYNQNVMKPTRNANNVTTDSETRERIRKILTEFGNLDENALENKILTLLRIKPSELVQNGYQSVESYLRKKIRG